MDSAVSWIILTALAYAAAYRFARAVINEQQARVDESEKEWQREEAELNGW